MFNSIRGPARERIAIDEVQAFPQSPALVVDDRRRRPLYFDGRFLRAADLTRDQNYFLTRQDDLGRAGGMGVVHGLMVTQASDAAISISPGHGVCPSGELVVIDQMPAVNLADIATMQGLDAAFGLLRIPGEPARNRSGLYVIALRPVEFSANPIASYPTTIQGSRSVRDGDIIEAAAVTLVPYFDPGATKEIKLRRARAAYDVFVSGVSANMPANALPLAMIALDHGTIQWIDPYLVRREVGAEHGQVLGLGFTRRAVREAHALQYDAHLQSVLSERQQSNRGQRFAATEHFYVLPSAGRMPSAAIDPASFTQIFFPPDVDTELSLIPSDELPALLEESWDLPPIDLTLTGDELSSTSVVILIPVPRAQLRATEAVTGTIKRTLLPVAPGILAKRTPLQNLQNWKIASLAVSLPPPPPDPVLAAWRKAVPTGTLLWYIRRRNFAARPSVEGVIRVLAGDEVATDQKLADGMKAFALDTRVNALLPKATSPARAQISAFLATPRFLNAKILTEDALTALEAQAPLNTAAVYAVMANYADPQLGSGLARLERLVPDARKNEDTIKAMITAKKIRDIDLLMKQAADDNTATALGKNILTLAATGKLDTLPAPQPVL